MPSKSSIPRIQAMVAGAKAAQNMLSRNGSGAPKGPARKSIDSKDIVQPSNTSRQGKGSGPVPLPKRMSQPKVEAGGTDNDPVKRSTSLPKSKGKANAKGVD